MMAALIADQGDPGLLTDPVRVVMELLGHSQMRTTTDTYSQVMPALGRDAGTRNDEGRSPSGRTARSKGWPDRSKLETVRPVQRLAAGLPALLHRPETTKPKPGRQVQRRLTPEQVEQLVTEYRAGSSVQELAAKWRLHRTTVSAQGRRAGVRLRL
jgi:hypothetical protein